jgi:hypothetical protein
VSYYKFDLLCNRLEKAKAVRFANSDETDKAFSQKEQRYDQTYKNNTLFNTKSQVVRKELAKQL